MAGKARLAAACTELEIAASAAGLTVGEWIVDRVASGADTFVSIADRFTRKSGIEISRNVLTKAVHALVPDAERLLATARKEAAHAMVETQHETIMDLPANADKEEVAVETLKMRSTQWIAERFNRPDFGTNVKVEHELGPNALHLAVLKERSAARAKQLMALPVLLSDVATPQDHDDPEDLI